MRVVLIKAVILFTAAFSSVACTNAQPSNVVKPHRILILLDGSATMQGSKYTSAIQLITGMAEEMYGHNEDIQFGLRAFGHLLPAEMKICNDTRREVPFSKNNITQLGLRLRDIKPTGNGSLNYAFAEAVKNELWDTANYQYSIIVVADTSKQCRENNCIAHPASALLYRKYLIEFGHVKKDDCYDSVFGGNVAGYRAIIDHVLSQYPAKGKEHIVIAAPAARSKPLPNTTLPRRDTVVSRPARATNDGMITERPETDTFGVANIVNTSNLYTIILYQKEADGTFTRIDELFFSGAPSKIVKLKPGMYKAAFSVGGIVHAAEFRIERGTVTNIRVE